MSNRRLTPELLLQAYAQGIFPMAETRDDPEVFWVDPKKRGVFPLNNFHISRSLARRLRGENFSVTINKDFEGVVTACSDRQETWINETIFSLYRSLHGHGYAHSLEVNQGGSLIGGVYGVTLGAAFFGESMFSYSTDGSKIALAYLVDRLNCTGFHLFDTQFLTPHLASLGAVEISRDHYHKKLSYALEHAADFGSEVAIPSAYEVLQRNNQTS